MFAAFRAFSLAVVFLCSSILGNAAFAATYYVATGGNDANAGTLSAPLRSVQRAADIARPGDTIEIRAGTYPGAWIRPPANPVANSWITLKPYNGESVTLTAAGNPGGTSRALAFFDPACDITLYDFLDANGNPLPDGCKAREVYWSVEGLKLIGNPGNGNVVKIDTPRVRLLNNNISGSFSELVKLVRTADDVEIRGNEIHHTAGAGAMGIDIVGADRTTIVNNYIHDIHNIGIFAKGNSRNTMVESNRVENAQQRGIMLGNLTGKQFMKDGPYETYDGVVRNNIVRNTAGPCLGAASSWNAKIQNNSCYNVASNSQAAIFIAKESQWNQGNTHIEVRNNIIVPSASLGWVVKVALGAMSDNNTLHIDNNLYWNANGVAGAVYYAWEDLPAVYAVNYDQWKAMTALRGLAQDVSSRNLNPKFSNTTNLTIAADSPAVDAGVAAQCATRDFIGNARPADGNGDGVPACDIGAYEVGSIGAPPPPAQSCLTVMPTNGAWQWLNTAFAAQTGTFTAQFDVTPMNAGEDALISLTSGAQTFWNSLAATIRFNVNNTIDVLNGGTYSAGVAVPYTPNSTYRMRVVVNVSGHTYSVYVTPPNAAERLLAANYAFRTGQQSITSANNLNLASGIGALKVCNLSITGGGNTGDAQPPTVAMTAPTAGAAASGVVKLAAQAADNVGVAGVQFLVDGNAVGSEDAGAPYTSSFDTTTLTNGNHTFAARVRDAAGNTATSVPVVVAVANSCQTAAPGVNGAWGWINVPFAAQAGVFTAEWDAIPLNAGLDALMSFTPGAQTSWGSLAATVRLNINNAMDAINNSTSVYNAASLIAYAPNTLYHFRAVVNVPGHSYSVYITPQGGAEQVLAANYLFRSTQQAVAGLSNFNLGTGSGSVRACNVRITQ